MALHESSRRIGRCATAAHPYVMHLYLWRPSYSAHGTGLRLAPRATSAAAPSTSPTSLARHQHQHRRQSTREVWSKSARHARTAAVVPSMGWRNEYDSSILGLDCWPSSPHRCRHERRIGSRWLREGCASRLQGELMAVPRLQPRRPTPWWCPRFAVCQFCESLAHNMKRGEDDRHHIVSS